MALACYCSFVSFDCFHNVLICKSLWIKCLLNDKKIIIKKIKHIFCMTIFYRPNHTQHLNLTTTINKPQIMSKIIKLLFGQIS